MLQMIPPIQHHIHTDPHTPTPTPTPGWQHRVWDTTTIPSLIDNDHPICDLYLHYLNEGNHTAIRHLLRIPVLAKMGGIYTDPDTYLAEGLRTSPYMDEDAWLTLAPTQPEDPHAEPNILGRVIATRPGHPYLNSLRRAIVRLAENVPPTATELGDILLTDAYARKKRKDIPLVELATVTAPPPAPEHRTRTPAVSPPLPEPEPTPNPEPATEHTETEPAPTRPEPAPAPRRKPDYQLWNSNPVIPRTPARTRVPPESGWH